MCIHPIKIRNPKVSARSPDPFMEVPCSRCIACKQTKARQWSFRLTEEDKISKTAYFITLTYQDKNLPINKNYTYPELNKDHLKAFFKALREKNKRDYPKYGKTKYYATGEYGGQTGRPHYHAIVFNAHPNIIKHLGKLWKHGNTHVDSCNLETISYTTGYIMSKDSDKSRELERQIEFSLMSKGMGLNYLKHNARYHVENETYMTKFQGNNFAIPRYFREKIFSEEQRDQLSYELNETLQIAKQEKLQELREKGDKYPEATLKKNSYAQARLLQHKMKKDKF